LVCGVSPWSREQQVEMAAGVLVELRMRPMERLCPGVPAALVALVERTLDRDPQRRPTAAELAAALEGLAPQLDDSGPAGERPPPGSLDDEVTSMLPAAKWPG
jgi:hypothetical protein